MLLVVAGRVLELPAGEPAATVVAAQPVPVPVPDEAPAPVTDAAHPAGFRRRTCSADTTAAGDVVRTGALPVPARPVDPADAEIFPPVDAPDHDAAEAAHCPPAHPHQAAGVVGPARELGNWVAACQGICPPRPLRSPTGCRVRRRPRRRPRRRVGVPAGGHPRRWWPTSPGRAAINVLARRAGATVRVADLSVDADTNPAVAAFKVRRSSGDLPRVTDDLSIDEARRALAAGRAIADSPSTPVRIC